MELTVQNVYGLILRSKLLAVDEAKAMYTRWQEEAKDASGNLTRFASWLVANRFATEYQAALLVRGHADGFFLNDYKILDRLGKGRMAGVYKAQHRLGQIFAIKVLPPSRAGESNLLGRFQREAKLAMRLKHPNIVRTFQIGQAGDLHYLVMEYLEGETLEDVLARRKKMPPAEAARLVFQALQGLQHIHAQGLVHRDLKPANLMLVGSAPDTTARATVKLLDIGLGRVLFDDSEAPTLEGLTGEGVLLGTPDYMSPEQARDPRTADIRSDVYSLGCVLYHALAGQPPFPDTNIISQMIRHATEPPRPLKDFSPAVPDGLQQILNWMLAKDPAGRYPTPDRAAQALQMFLTAGAEQLHAPESDPKMRTYLTWLQVEDTKSPAVPVAVVAAAGPTTPTLSMPAAPRPAASAAPPLPSALRPAAPPPAPPAAPAAKPPKLPKPARPPGEADKHRHASGKRRHKKKHRSKHTLPPLPPTAAGAAPPAAINVELVPMPPPTKPAPQTLLKPPYSRRDFVVFGVGIGAGALVTFLGCLAAVFGKGSTQPHQNPPPPPDDKDKPPGN